jgi:AraC family transcriptional regulator
MVDVNVKKSKAYKAVYIEHVGAYDKVPYGEYFDRLFGWAKKKNLRPVGPPMAIFLDKPEETPPEKIRCEVLIPIQGEAKPEGEVKVKEIPSTDVASITHRGATKNYPKTYEKLNKWVEENGYVYAGPVMEIYLSKPKIAKGETVVFTNIQAPIKRK